MRIYEKDELEKLIISLQPKSKYSDGPIWLQDLGLGPQSARLAYFILQTALWCHRHTHVDEPNSSLRKIQLDTFVLRKSVFQLFQEIHFQRWNPQFEGKRHSFTSKDLQIVFKGKFLAFFPNYSLWHGAANGETNGFFDDEPKPPWDSWVDYFEDPTNPPREHLISWIPEAFIPIAQAGIDVNPEQCIYWADEDSDLLFNAIWHDLKHVLIENFG